MKTWRTALAVGEAQQHMHMDLPEEEAPREKPTYMFERGPRKPGDAPAFKVGDKVAVTPDEDDDFDQPFVGTIAHEPSYNDIFDQFVYAIHPPDGDEVHCFEKQLQKA
jgi:hypothetical protein